MQLWPHLEYIRLAAFVPLASISGRLLYATAAMKHLATPPGPAKR
jgi:hypothetical protein